VQKTALAELEPPASEERSGKKSKRISQAWTCLAPAHPGKTIVQG
jgi:hypothetical protein